MWGEAIRKGFYDSRFKLPKFDWSSGGDFALRFGLEKICESRHRKATFSFPIPCMEIGMAMDDK